MPQILDIRDPNKNWYQTRDSYGNKVDFFPGEFEALGPQGQEDFKQRILGMQGRLDPQSGVPLYSIPKNPYTDWALSGQNYQQPKEVQTPRYTLGGDQTTKSVVSPEQFMNPGNFQPLTNPVSAPSSYGATTPPFPTPQAGSVQGNYFDSATSNLTNSRSTLESAYKSQVDYLQSQMDKAQKKIDDLETLQKEGVLSNIKDLSQPFRDSLEKSQRETLHINENFEANQTLTNELNTLLTEGNQIIKEQKETTGLASFRNPRIQQTISDITARTGVIQAVMAARNSQITVAENLIDRTVVAMTADKKDQISYYSTLLDFYQKQKDEQGTKLLNLTKDQRTYINAQIGLLENDVKSAQSNADYIKEAMMNPATALAYAQAGVSLTDNPQQINAKLGKFYYSKEISEINNKMALDEWTPVAPGQTAPAGYKTTQVTDSKGIKYGFYKKESGKDGTLNVLDVARYNELYPGAGVVAGDTETTANAKVAELSKPKDFTDEQLRQATKDDLSKNIPYEQVIADIDSNALVKNKDRAKLIAGEIYRKEGKDIKIIGGAVGKLYEGSKPYYTKEGGVAGAVYNYLFK